jgi:bifunctional non-homologous end joining protein LigD
LLAEIEYRAKSVEGKLRHPFFKGNREDLGGHL